MKRNGFSIMLPNNDRIRFSFYLTDSPVTAKAFSDLLPLSRKFYHARVSGQEIWFDDLPPLDIPQENASVFTVPGEVVLGPSRPSRTKTANCFGIYYGDGKGLDACNIFACVIEEDRIKLSELGNSIWKRGAQSLTISAWEE